MYSKVRPGLRWVLTPIILSDSPQVRSGGHPGVDSNPLPSVNTFSFSVTTSEQVARFVLFFTFLLQLLSSLNFTSSGAELTEIIHL